MFQQFGDYSEKNRLVSKPVRSVAISSVRIRKIVSGLIYKSLMSKAQINNDLIRKDSYTSEVHLDRTRLPV